MKLNPVLLTRTSRKSTIPFALLGMTVATFVTAASAQEPAPPLPPPPDPPPPAPEAPPPQTQPPAPHPSPYPPPATGYPPHGYPPHGYPPHGYPPHGYPPYGYAPYGQGYVAPPPPPAAPKKPKHAEARADDKVSLSAGIFLYNVIGIGMGLQAGLFVAPDTLIDVDFLNAAAILPNLPRSNSVSLGVRQFVGETFYVRGALRGRMLRTSEWWDVDNDNYDEFVDRTDIGIDFALGNRWQFGDLAIGVDWFGAYRPLIHLSATGVTQHQVTGLENRTDLDRDDVETQHDLRIGFFHIGGSF